MQKLRFLFTCLSFCSLFLAGCGEDAITPENISGYWALRSATREAQPTTTLEGTWLEFDQNGNAFKTNLPLGFTGTETFAIQKKQITVTSQPPIVFDVTAATDSTLALAFQTHGFAFTLLLEKAEKPAELPQQVVPVEQ